MLLLFLDRSWALCLTVFFPQDSKEKFPSPSSIQRITTHSVYALRTNLDIFLVTIDIIDLAQTFGLLKTIASKFNSSTTCICLKVIILLLIGYQP